MIKCLLCNFATNDQNELKEHLHNVDRDNQFFINLFRRQNNSFCRRRCLRCNEVSLNHRFKVNHDFLVHFGTDRDADEERSLFVL